MGKILIRLLFICLIIGMAAGCNPQSEQKLQINESVLYGNAFDIAVDQGEFTSIDSKYLESFRELITSTLKVLSELEVHLAEAQEHDESTEAESIMEQTNEKILFIWNQLHNGIVPEHPVLTQSKGQYENLLMDLRKGIQTEIEGFQTGDPAVMKEGYALTETAKDQLREFAHDLFKMMGWPTRIEQDSHIH
ncbi:hypothetical protein [Ammoniphilus resinae]|uniref:Lipoprotein n=1 Tax=Ammoniphilus resinae TaxID=861532 RepID=A0ABS4GMY9_9BACL|nr:hypothetical protein [Ammoniphilus resinae]MBP1931652.1 hypothetical protein [Ammoniphilus resinae]